MITKSIRWRLQLWQALLLVLVLAGFGVTAFQLHRTNRIRDVDTELSRRLVLLAADVRGGPPFPDGPGRRFDPPGTNEGPPPPFDFPRFSRDRDPEEFRRGPRGRPGQGPGRFNLDDFLENRQIHLSPATTNLFANTAPEGFYFAVWSRNGTRLLQSTNAPPDLPNPSVANKSAAIQVRTRGNYRESFQFTEIGECILVGRSMAAEMDGLRRFASLLIAAGGTVLLAGLGGGWFLAGRALRPIADISSAASRISAGNLQERIDAAETDSELGKLAAVLNSTFSRLEAAFAQQRQFTADASHELRTPLAVMIAEAQSTLARERNATEYRESLETCLEAAQELKKLAQSLLELAALDAGRQILSIQEFNLADRVRAVVEMLSSLAREAGVEIDCNVPDTVITGDPDRLTQVVTNLLTNAVQYNRPGGRVSVSLDRNARGTVLRVRDTGIGIAPDDLPHVFDRFYRSDKARSSRKGHVGLGLAIVQGITTAHGGTVEVESTLEKGTTFTILLPHR